ncbi:MAG: DUF302 domain-containing protein [Alphaproteobacteria bacterium]|nr:DUF302 domain-containing protein [Alphaproteobacteria bacterium SS10]
MVVPLAAQADHDVHNRDYGHHQMTMSSPHDVPTTVQRLKAAIEKRGAKVFAVIDHAAGAESVGKALRPTTTVIFGNPKLGTPIMIANQKAAFDLPLRVLVMEDESGQTILLTNEPAYYQETYRLPETLPQLKGMDKAIFSIFTEVVGQ